MGVMLLLAALGAFAADTPAPSAQPLVGNVPPDPEVDAALAALAPGLAGCHAGEEPAKYQVRVQVRADGTVSNVDLTGPAPNACVHDALSAATFPPREGDYLVTRALTLAPTGATFSVPIILGALDKSHIDAVIKAQMAKIRYCYQRELTKDPELAGKLVVKFVIAKDGTVSSATTKASTLGNESVERCVNERFMRFAFDAPKGGGIVIVSYPFIFSPDTGRGVYTAAATFEGPPPGKPAGSLAMAEIDAVISGARTSLLDCRDAEDPGLWGEVVVQLVIAADGTVSTALTTSSTMKSADVEACVAGVLSRLRFPEPDGDGVVVVSYPLIFASR
jgi:hypothetical protein